MRHDFPERFWWGAATSGPQAEGRFNKKHKSVFDYWYEISPKTFYNEVGPDVASNFYNSYKEDIKMLREIGLNSYRPSIQWTRLIKNFETCEVDEDGVRFYNDVINECIKNNIEIIMNLHHFDLPVELYDKYGGWESKYVVDLFAKFASKAFELFADRVKYWATFNEPTVVVNGQYLHQYHYPCLRNGKKFVQASYNIALASAKAVKAFKEGNYNGEIGIILNVAPSYPRSYYNKADVEAAHKADLFDRVFLDSGVLGIFPEELTNILRGDNVLWESTKEELEIIKSNTVDFLGLNYYAPRRVKAKESEFKSDTWMPDKYYDYCRVPGKRINQDRGWEIYPKGLYDMAKLIQEEYGNIKWYVSENGMGVANEEKYKNEDGIIDDDYRVTFIREHLEWLHKAIDEGSNCIGYHMWTGIDCWSWCNAYKNRYGFISLDLETLEKTPKKSANWIKELSENNGF